MTVASLSQNQACYRQLRRLLLLGQIPPGTRMREVEWARKLGVHRSALREAMLVLAHEGLLIQSERRGYSTPAPEKRDLDEIMEARAIIEVGAIRLIGARPPGEVDLSPLAQACDMSQQLLEAGLELGFLEADRRFHEVLVELSGNEKLVSIYRRAPLPITPSRIADADARRAGALQTITDHRRIHQLIQDRQIAEAIEALERHLHTAHRLAPIQ